MSEFHAKVPQANASEGIAPGPYVAARAGFEPVTIRTKCDESTSEPLRPMTGLYLKGLGMWMVIKVLSYTCYYLTIPRR